MNILGISCYYHDSCAVLIRDGKIVAAAQEERFNRDKYSPVFPIQAINWCLQEGGITSYDLDHVAFYEKMYLKFERTILSHLNGWPFTLRNFLDTMPLWLKDRLAVPYVIEEEILFRKPIYHVKHHLSHAASSYYSSGFDRAAVLTVDGVGEWATASWGVAGDQGIQIRKELRYPHSLGLLYSIVTAYLGFRVFSGEGKVMALAEFGEPEFLPQFRKVLRLLPDGSFFLDSRYFQFNRGDKMHGPEFEKLFGPERAENSQIEARHRNIACSLQRFTEEILLAMARHVRIETGERKLCLAGGVFLNVTANSRLIAEAGFDEVFIQPAVGDAGAALGAAQYVHHEVVKGPRMPALKSAALGPAYSERQIEVLLRNRGAKFEKVSDPAVRAARLLAEGKVVGWFQGRMEFGPRALGNRSILADPRDPNVKQRLNAIIKKREDFRPFAASALQENAREWFDLPALNPFMLVVGTVRPEKLAKIPAVVHVNHTSRVQAVSAEDGRYHQLISEFNKITGVPMVLNTSFNEDEPIVCSPEQAWECFAGTEMDALVMENYLVARP